MFKSQFCKTVKNAIRGLFVIWVVSNIILSLMFVFGTKFPRPLFPAMGIIGLLLFSCLVPTAVRLSREFYKQDRELRIACWAVVAAILIAALHLFFGVVLGLYKVTFIIDFLP